MKNDDTCICEQVIIDLMATKYSGERFAAATKSEENEEPTSMRAHINRWLNPKYHSNNVIGILAMTLTMTMENRLFARSIR